MLCNAYYVRSDDMLEHSMAYSNMLRFTCPLSLHTCNMSGTYRVGSFHSLFVGLVVRLPADQYIFSYQHDTW